MTRGRSWPDRFEAVLPDERPEVEVVPVTSRGAGRPSSEKDGVLVPGSISRDPDGGQRRPRGGRTPGLGIVPGPEAAGAGMWRSVCEDVSFGRLIRMAPLGLCSNAPLGPALRCRGLNGGAPLGLLCDAPAGRSGDAVGFGR